MGMDVMINVKLKEDMSVLKEVLQPMILAMKYVEIVGILVNGNVMMVM
jgi:hypothetical protein